MVPMIFENVPTGFKRWTRFILPRVNGKCNVRAWAPMRNLSKSSQHFSSRTMRHIGSKSSLCNSPGGSLYAGKRSPVIRRFVPEILWGTDRQTHTHTRTHSTSINIRDSWVEMSRITAYGKCLSHFSESDGWYSLPYFLSKQAPAGV